MWRKAITYPGTALAWCFSVVIAYFAGVWGFLSLAATLVFTLIAGKISGKKRENAEKKLHAKHGRRDSVQIICNVGTAAVMALLYGLTEWAGFLCACGGALVCGNGVGLSGYQKYYTERAGKQSTLCKGSDAKWLRFLY